MRLVNKILVLPTIVILSLVGCQAFTVYEGTTERKGVPFYVKKGQIEQVTQYSRSWVEITLQYSLVEQSGKTTQKDSMKLFAAPSTFTRSGALTAHAAAVTKINQTNGFLEAVKEFKNNCPSGVCDLTRAEIDTESDPTYMRNNNSRLHQTLISNTSSLVTKVDYSKLYYFNSQTPPFGTATATAELAEDGTLSKASGTVDSTKLADLIPLKEFLLDKLDLVDPIPPAPGHPGPTPPPEKVLSMSIKTDGYHYKFTETHPVSAGLSIAPIAFGGSDNVVRSSFGSSSAKKADDSNAIQISGSIQMPKKK